LTRAPDQEFLLGRGRDLDALAEMFDRGRLVTIRGPGGMGKTTLARAYLQRWHQARDADPEQVAGMFCDFTEASAEQDAFAVVRDRLQDRLRERSARGRLGKHERAATARSLGTAFATLGPTLLVLDNVEQLADTLGKTIALWLELAPELSVLVTSRVSLGASSEQTWSLEPLPIEAARELFLQRAQMVKPNFDGTRFRGDIDQIVEAIDRMPLAIELAATRMAALTIVELRARIAEPLAILSSNREVTRHATIRRTVLDSISALPEDLRPLFYGCASMQNGFDGSAAEAVLNHLAPGGDVLAGLEALVNASLLRATPVDERTYFSLFETVRAAANEQLSDASHQALRTHVRALHASYYRGHAATWSSIELRANAANLFAARDELARVMTDLERACDFATFILALGPLYSARAMLNEVEQITSATLEALHGFATEQDEARRSTPRGTLLTAQLHVMRGRARAERGMVEEASADFATGLEQIRATTETRTDADACTAARAIAGIAELRDLQGDTIAARDGYRQALIQLRESPPSPRALEKQLAQQNPTQKQRARDKEARTTLEGEILLGLGHTYRREGNLRHAKDAIEDAIMRFEDVCEFEGLAAGYYELAVVESFRGEFDASLKAFERGLSMAEREGLPLYGAALTTARGNVLQDLGRPAEALALHAEAARVFADVASRYREASATYYLATTYLELRELREADRMLHRAESCLEDIRSAHYRTLIAGARVFLCILQERDEDARSSFARLGEQLALVRHEPALSCFAGFVGRALEHSSAGRPASDASQLLADAEAQLAAAVSDDSRFALRMLRRVLERDASSKGSTPNAAAVSAPSTAPTLTVGIAGRGFRLPKSDTWVVLPESSPQRRLLDRLTEERLRSPQSVVAVSEMIEAGWPGDKANAGSALNRLYVALSALRKLGLKEYLVKQNGGYALSVGVLVIREEG
jgi:predicted ATPase